MTTLMDARLNALRAQGFTGAMPDMLLQWLQANGATSKQVMDAWAEMLASKGISAPHVSDGWFELLGVLGYTGTRNDRERAFWVAGGTFPP